MNFTAVPLLCIHHYKYFNVSFCKSIHISATMHLKQQWRKKNNLAKNPNSFGPLTNLPDYTFKDGRPTPYGVKEKARIDRHHRLGIKMKELVSQIDYAVERYERLQKEKALRKQEILDAKLMPKGNLLLKSNKKDLTS